MEGLGLAILLGYAGAQLALSIYLVFRTHEIEDRIIQSKHKLDTVDQRLDFKLQRDRL